MFDSIVGFVRQKELIIWKRELKKYQICLRMMQKFIQ